MPALHVERSIQVNAPRGKVYATVRDFHEWPVWSPWLICDPATKLTFESDGRGYQWDSKYIGAGSIEVTEETEGVSIDYELIFLRPFKSKSHVRFEFANAGDATKVTWLMDGKLPLFLFWLRRTMETMIGMDYDRGLRMLKEYQELGEVRSGIELIGNATVQGFAYVGIRNQCGLAEIGPSMERDFAAVCAKVEQAGIEPVGAPFSIYHQWNFSKGQADYTIGVPVAQAPVELPQGMVADRLPDCEVYSIKHTGAYHHLGNAWATGYSRVQNKVFKQDKQTPPFEIYQNDPRDTDEADLVTIIHFPVKS